MYFTVKAYKISWIKKKTHFQKAFSENIFKIGLTLLTYT